MARKQKTDEPQTTEPAEETFRLPFGPMTSKDGPRTRASTVTPVVLTRNPTQPLSDPSASQND